MNRVSMTVVLLAALGAGASARTRSEALLKYGEAFRNLNHSLKSAENLATQAATLAGEKAKFPNINEVVENRIDKNGYIKLVKHAIHNEGIAKDESQKGLSKSVLDEINRALSKVDKNVNLRVSLTAFSEKDPYEYVVTRLRSYHDQLKVHRGVVSEQIAQSVRDEENTNVQNAYNLTFESTKKSEEQNARNHLSELRKLALDDLKDTFPDRRKNFLAKLKTLTPTQLYALAQFNIDQVDQLSSDKRVHLGTVRQETTQVHEEEHEHDSSDAESVHQQNNRYLRIFKTQHEQDSWAESQHSFAEDEEFFKRITINKVFKNAFDYSVYFSTNPERHPTAMPELGVLLTLEATLKAVDTIEALQRKTGLGVEMTQKLAELKEWRDRSEVTFHGDLGSAPLKLANQIDAIRHLQAIGVPTEGMVEALLKQGR